MESLHRGLQLLSLLHYSRQPVPKAQLLTALECSNATLKRLLQALRDQYQYRIAYCRTRNGYYLDPAQAEQIPGLWFGAEELHALLLSRQLLASIQPGGLDQHFQALAERVDNLLSATTGQPPSEALARIRVLPLSQPAVPREIFRPLSRAVLHGRRVQISYRDINGQTSQRDVSPQRLVYYRDQWYLDAHCHLREALRVFWLAGIEQVEVLDQPARLIPAHALARELEASYGIFTGQPTRTAHLRFTGRAAMRLRHSRWHPDQRQQLHEDGSLELWLPYADDRELVMDVLRYGAEVEVLGPPSLKDEVVRRLGAALEKYLGVDASRLSG